MDQTTDGVGIKIYNNAVYGDPHDDESTKSPPKPPPPSSSSQPLPLLRLNPDHLHGRKRRAVAKGVQKTLSKTSMLANFLPTGTLLTFEMVLPAIYRTGECTRVTTMMTYGLLGMCALSCFFFHFTDSFRGPDGKLYYGFVTQKGLAVFKPGLMVEVPKEERYKLGLSDFVHAIMSVMVFVAIAFSDRRVTDCLFPGHEKDMDEVMESFPLMVGIVCSGLFLVFPSTRYGIGCMAA
ncbi:protein DMP8-like [Pyrus communis]|uniref:protein DMP8-like n=1 Tax=Pyrus communis TaxID=23211 RepID=UPI0035C09747